MEIMQTMDNIIGRSFMAKRVGDQFMGKHVDRYDPVDRVAYSYNLLANLPHVMARMLATV
jgi:hypothetical protein